MREKQALTTGEVAKYCGVNFRTVIRWIERGHLEAYKLPGRGDNRIPVESFINFLQDNNMPIPEGLSISQNSLLIYAENDECSAELASFARRAGWDVLISQEPVQFGFYLATRQPKVIILTKPEVQQALERLLREIDNPELLLIWINSEQPTVADKGWHSIQWPQQQNTLNELLQGD